MKKGIKPLEIVLKLPKSVTRSEAPTWLPPLQILGVSYVLVHGGEEGWKGGDFQRDQNSLRYTFPVTFCN